jgi:hypothetical protein
MLKFSTTYSKRHQRSFKIVCAPESLSSKRQYCRTRLYLGSQFNMPLVMHLVTSQEPTFCVAKLTQFLALYNAATAFCEGLHGETNRRSSRAHVDYKVLDHAAIPQESKTNSRASPVVESLGTLQARSWWQICTSSKLFPVMTIARKWVDFYRTSTRWQTVFFPQNIIDGWRDAAQNSEVKVSTFDLFTSWIHLVSISQDQPILQLCA